MPTPPPGFRLRPHRPPRAGATLDRAFVLGSREELYREWGYTALSRHREEARFYVSAAPTSSTGVAEPVSTAADPAREVTRALSASRAQRLALDGLAQDPMRGLLADDLKHAGELAAVETQLSACEVDARPIPAASQSSPRRSIRSQGSNRERLTLTASVTSGSSDDCAFLARRLRHAAGAHAGRVDDRGRSGEAGAPVCEHRPRVGAERAHCHESSSANGCDSCDRRSKQPSSPHAV